MEVKALALPWVENAEIAKKMNHHASFCKSNTTTTFKRKPQQKRGVHVVEAADDSSSDDAHVYKLTMCGVTVGANKIDERPHFVVSVNGHRLDVIADSGAEINIIDERNYDEMKPKPKLRHDNTKILPYGSTMSLPVKGIFEATVKSSTQQSYEICLRGSRFRWLAARMEDIKTSKPGMRGRAIIHKQPVQHSCRSSSV